MDTPYAWITNFIIMPKWVNRGPMKGLLRPYKRPIMAYPKITEFFKGHHLLYRPKIPYCTYPTCLYTPLAKRTGRYKRMGSATSHPEMGGHPVDKKCPFRGLLRTWEFVSWQILIYKGSIDLCAKWHTCTQICRKQPKNVHNWPD